MPNLPSFMAGVPRLPTNNSGTSATGAQPTGAHQTAGTQGVAGHAFTGHKSVDAHPGATNGVPSAKGDSTQIKKRSRRGK